MTRSSSSTSTTKATKTTRAKKASKSAAAPVKASPAKATSAKTSPTKATSAKAAAKKIPAKATGGAGTTTRLLSGGNPQAPKGDGDAAVQAYISAIPDWKRDVGRQLDALITDTIPGVRKGVRWNSAFYGVEGGWHIAFHCITRYMKVAFFQGAALQPMPPEASAQADVRYLHVHEDTPIDAAQFRAWVRQAFARPPTKM